MSSDLYTKSFYSPKYPLVARKAYIPPDESAKYNRVNYAQSFFTTPSSNYKTYPAVNTGELVFANREGQTFRVKDYDYAVINPAIGNPSIAIYLKDPDTYITRNDSWFLVR